jgi:hypothetical protein
MGMGEREMYVGRGVGFAQPVVLSKGRGRPGSLRSVRGSSATSKILPRRLGPTTASSLVFDSGAVTKLPSERLHWTVLNSGKAQSGRSGLPIHVCYALKEAYISLVKHV